MRRTYRSKKETGGAFDHRDAIQALDEKASAFEAFYIQNIKQTKRELSCVGSLNQFSAGTNKVRKRKYVKRIVKEPETSLRESLGRSALLTPDKSIRVNKPQDLFDQLLNSSPLQKGSPKNCNVFKSQPTMQGKTYSKRKISKIKKFNYSSTDTSDSDKENSNENCNNTKDVSDIVSHELLIEKENGPSPKYLDESIKNIVKNMSLINNLKYQKNKLSLNSSYISNSNNNSVSSNFHSPSLPKSPLCSTPFKEKYRSKSIYKFSPIAVNKNEESPNYVTIVEENDDMNDSVVFVHNKHESQIPSPSKCGHSPIIHLSVNKSTKSDKSGKMSSFKMATPQTSLNRSECCRGDRNLKDDIHPVSKEMTSIEISDLQTTEVEPFLGFSKKSIEFKKLPKANLESLEYENSNVSDQIEFNNSEHDANEIFVNNDKTVSEINSESTESEFENSNSEVSENNSSYDTCNSNQSFQSESDSEIRVPIVVMKRLNDSIFNKYYEKFHECYMQDDAENAKSNTIESDDYASLEDIDASSNTSDSSISSELDNEQQRNTSDVSHEEINISSSSILENSVCTSFYQNDSFEEDRCISFVTTRRRNEVSKKSLLLDFNSSFDRTFGEDCDKTVLSNKINNETLEEENSNLKLNATVTQFGQVKMDEVDECNEKGITEDEYSFINLRPSTTTFRKSNKVIDESIEDENYNISVINATITQNDETEMDLVSETTVKCNTRDENTFENVSPLTACNRKSNKKIDESTEENSCNLSVINATITENDQLDKDVAKCSTEVENSFESTTPAEVSDRESLRILKFRDSIQAAEKAEQKTAIVLQPGKKWERSLSIYRRMTMMADHFDHSILEDEQLHHKGRKYRQSVLSTIEMQDFKGSLHNDSIISRRSTFVSKPCRSTIRIIKEPNSSRLSLCSTSEDLKGFLSEDCDDTIVELSKLSIADSEHEVTVLEKFHDTSSRVSTARDYVLRRCNQTETILFDECYPETVLKNCRKIGEGVYGEVFLWRARDGRARVMKIVPIAGSIKVNGEQQKDFHEIISEIVIAMELSALRAPIDEIQRSFDEGKNVDALDLHSVENATDVFNEVLAVRCVYGAYPSRLLDLWELYDECKGSENDNPAILPADQQYIVLELANAGQDLESYEFNSAEQAHALFLQVAYGLAVGEEAFQFEHRDLHWGNVLIAPTDQKFATFVLRGRAHRVPRCGVAATIIDYSLSRLSLPLAADAAALYNDLAADDGLFDAVGDYQFEVYRLMREKLGNDWKNFEPYTNILWLHYTVDKMITALRYKRTNTKIHKHYIAKLKGIKNRILSYGSAAQFVLTDNEF